MTGRISPCARQDFRTPGQLADNHSQAALPCAPWTRHREDAVQLVSSYRLSLVYRVLALLLRLRRFASMPRTGFVTGLYRATFSLRVQRLDVGTRQFSRLDWWLGMERNFLLEKTRRFFAVSGFRATLRYERRGGLVLSCSCRERSKWPGTCASSRVRDHTSGPAPPLRNLPN